MKNLLLELEPEKLLISLCVFIILMIIGVVIYATIHSIEEHKSINRSIEKARLNNSTLGRENFWSELEVNIVAFLTTYISYKNLKPELIELISTTLGRSKGSINRKLQRINALKWENKKGSSVLDRKVYQRFSKIGEENALNIALESFYLKGGNIVELKRLYAASKS